MECSHFKLSGVIFLIPITHLNLVDTKKYRLQCKGGGGGFTGFSKLKRKLIIQNGDLRMLNRSQNSIIGLL